MNKRGEAGEWSVGKLVSLILVVAVAAMVIFGAISGWLSPLVEQVGGNLDKVLVFLHLKGEGSLGEYGDCYNVSILDMHPDGEKFLDSLDKSLVDKDYAYFTYCPDRCEIGLKKNAMSQESYIVDKIYVAVTPAETIKYQFYRELYQEFTQLLLDEFSPRPYFTLDFSGDPVYFNQRKGYSGYFLDDYFGGSTSPFVLMGSGPEEVYAFWQNGIWDIRQKIPLNLNQPLSYSWNPQFLDNKKLYLGSDDSKALDIFYNAAKGQDVEYRQSSGFASIFKIVGNTGGWSLGVFWSKDKLDSHKELSKLKTYFNNFKSNELKQNIVSSANFDKLKLALTGKTLTILGKDCKVDSVIRNADDYPFVKISCGKEIYGYGNGASLRESNLLDYDRHNYIASRDVPLGLYEYTSNSFVPIQNTEMYKLISKDFDKIFMHPMKINNFMKLKCR